MKRVSLSKRLVALILAFVTVVGIAVTLNAVSSAESLEYTDLEAQNYEEESSQEYTGFNSEGEAEKPQNSEPEAAPKNPEGKSGMPDGVSGRMLRNGTVIDVSTLTGTTVLSGQGQVYTLKGSKLGAMFNVIEVAAGSNITVYFDNVTITTAAYRAGAFTIKGNGNNAAPNTSVNVILKAGTSNKLHSGDLPAQDIWPEVNRVWENLIEYAGLQVHEGSTLTVDGPGALLAQSANDADYDGVVVTAPAVGSGGGAGIGGGFNRRMRPGHIVIRGGDITALGGQHCSGIGGGFRSSVNDAGGTNGTYHEIGSYGSLTNDILITGGNITSVGGLHGNGIGGACGSASNGVLVTLPTANVSASTHLSKYIGTPLGNSWPQVLYSTFSDLGSMGEFFYLGDPSKPVSFIDTSVAPSRLYKVENVNIVTDKPAAAGGLDLAIDFTANTGASILKTIARDPSLNPAAVPFGKIDAGKDRIERNAYFTLVGKISVVQIPEGLEAGDKLFNPATIGPSRKVAGGIATPYYGTSITDDALLITPAYRMGIKQSRNTKELKYGFNETDAKAAGPNYILYNPIVSKNVNISPFPPQTLVESDTIRRIGYEATGGQYNLFSFTPSTVVTPPSTPGVPYNQIAAPLENDGTDETSAKAKNFSLFLNPKKADGSGTDVLPGTYSGSGKFLGHRVAPTSAHDFSFAQVVGKGDYVDITEPDEDGSGISEPVPPTDPKLGKIVVTATPAQSSAPGTPINIVGNKVTLNFTVPDSNINKATVKVYYVVLDKGSKIPKIDSPLWKEFKDGAIVNYSKDGDQSIYYKTDSDIYQSRAVLKYYDVDITRPEFTNMAHVPDPSGSSNIIGGTNPETISVTTTEPIFSFKEANIIIEVLGGDSTAVKVVPGSFTGSGTSYSFQIKADGAKLTGGETIKIYISENAAKDRLGNPSLDSRDSGANFIDLTYDSGKPFSKFLDGIDAGNRIYRKLVDSVEVLVVANDGEKTEKLYVDNGGINRLTPATATLAYVNSLIEVKNEAGVVQTIASADFADNLSVGEKGGIFKLTFTTPLDNGKYSITLKSGTIFNIRGDDSPNKTRNFHVKIPRLSTDADAVSINKILFDEQGGKAVVTVKGEHLDQADEFILEEILKNQPAGKTIDTIKIKSKSSTKLEIELTFPSNATYDVHNLYQFNITMINSEGGNTGPIGVVYIKDTSIRPATIQVTRKKSVVKFDTTGGAPAVPSIIADRDEGNIGGIFDYTAYEFSKTGKSKAPIKKDHMFIGWYLKDVRNWNILDLNSTDGLPGGEYTLVARYLRLDTVIEDKDQDLGETKTDVTTPEEDTQKYPGENTKVEIEKEIGGSIDIVVVDKDGNESTISIPPHIEWDNEDFNTPGVKTGTVVITNPQTGEKIYLTTKVYIYVTKRAYITNRKYVTFEQYSRYTVDGSEWSPKVVEEIPDTIRKIIIIRNFPAKFDANGFNTELLGSHTVSFHATIINQRGIEEKVPSTTGIGDVMPRNEAAMAALAQSIDEDLFWINASQMTHLSVANESWAIDRTDYKQYGHKVGTIKSTKAFDILINVDANGYPRMSAEILQILKEQENTKLVVKYGEITWVFNSKDFKSIKKEPTGYFDLGYKHGNENAALNKLLGSRLQQQINFIMNNNFLGKGTITIPLEKALRGKTNLNLFFYNEDADQLEFVDKMTNNKDGTASVKVSEIRGTYVILDGLSKGSTSKAKETSKTLSYRITDITNDLDAKTSSELEKDLKSVGKSIKSITAKTADDITLSEITAKGLPQPKEKTFDASKFAGILLIVIAAAFITASFIYFRRKKVVVEEEFKIQ